jgi:hypothetical protein
VIRQHLGKAVGVVLQVGNVPRMHQPVAPVPLETFFFEFINRSARRLQYAPGGPLVLCWFQ